MMQPREYLTLKETAAMLGVHPRTVGNWIGRGLVSAYRTPGGQLRVAREDVRLMLGPARKDGSKP